MYRASAAAALGDRQDALDRLVDRLSAQQRRQLVTIAGRLLEPEARNELLLAELCRLCDRASCPQCPVETGYRPARRAT